jgi:beta-alanine--pyruvate transaminase
LKGAPHVVDIRNLGLVGAIELAPRDGAPGTRAYDVFVDCFKKGLLVRVTGDIIALSPPLIIEEDQIDTIVSMIGDALQRAV